MSEKLNKFNIGSSLFGTGITASLFLGVLIGLLSKNALAFKLYYGLDVDSFRGWLVVAIMVTVAGIALMLIGYAEGKSRKHLAATENLANRHFCYRCKVNVSHDTPICPICSEEIEVR